jgi:hypothetical protein
MVTIPSPNHVTYLEPLPTSTPTMSELLQLPGERELAENAINWFFSGGHFNPKDQANLERQFARRGWNIFVWKYYRVGRCYIGGYKALSATLMLRSI